MSAIIEDGQAQPSRAAVPPPELLARLDVAGPRYTSYPTVPVWSERYTPRDHAAALARAGAAGEPLSLYVHVPFCREMCSYCGCNVVVSRDGRKLDRYVAAVAAEAALVAEHLGGRRAVGRVHLGGGTPTSLDERQLAALWEALAARFAIAADAELAVEINPVVTRRGQLALLAGFGFRRLSMGVQDFDPSVQAAIGRSQTVAETRAAMEAARELGYRSVNLDLIYGLPRQNERSFRRTVAEVIALGPERVAVFSYAHVPSLKPHQRRLPIADLPAAADKLGLLLAAEAMLLAAGYRAIGMDHFALPTDELAAAAERRELGRDFQGYTARRAPSTVALGMSAISSLGGAYAQNEKTLSAYQDAVFSGRLATERGLWLSDEDRRRREVITALMCNFEVALDTPAAAYFAAELARLALLAADGLVEVEGGRVTVTPLGRRFVRNVAMVFDAYLPPGGAQGAFSRTV